MEKRRKAAIGHSFTSVCVCIAAIMTMITLPLIARANATLTTDKADYFPGEVVQITGAGFHPVETVQLRVTATDGGPTWDGGIPWYVQTDQQGSFASEWLLNEISPGRTFLLTADCMHPLGGSDSTPHLQASVTFTDPPTTCTECFPSLKSGNIPSTGTATIDGVENDFPNEWTASDLFAHMYNAGDPTKDNTSDAYVKFVCDGAKQIATVYVFVKMNAALGYTLLQDPTCPTSSIHNWIKVCNGSGSLVKATDSCLNSAAPAGSPTFNYVVVGTQTVGYEASFTLPAGATYNVVFHAEWTKSDSSTGTSAGEGFPQNGICMTLTCPDCTPPVVTCPPDKQLQCGDSIDPSNTGTASASGTCTPTVSFSDVVGGGCTGKNITRTWTATNSAGQTSTCVQLITFVDTTPPVITCPPDKFLLPGDSTDPSNTGTATATDNCGAVTITYSDVVSGGCSGNNVTRTWKATDPCGKVSACVQRIIFACPGCIPEITCPPDIKLKCGQSTDPSNTGTATATDDCGPVIITYSDVVGGGCNGNDVTRTWKATSSAGQTSTCVQHITFSCCPPLINIYQACSATSSCYADTGYAKNGESIPVITAAPGILSIVPGGDKWQNFVAAFHSTEANPFPTPASDHVTIKNVTLTKKCPDFTQCHGIFPTVPVVQQGTVNIRKWWPLMYEVPNCEFTLTILYGTDVLWDDDADGPNQPAWVHTEVWQRVVDANIPTVVKLLELFHQLPFGKDEVPLISDETLYPILVQLLLDAQAAYEVQDYATAADLLMQFELAVMDACIGTSPRNPNPSGPYTGIAQTDENPACCKLLVDIEYILENTGIGMPGKR